MKMQFKMKNSNLRKESYKDDILSELKNNSIVLSFALSIVIIGFISIFYKNSDTLLIGIAVSSLLLTVIQCFGNGNTMLNILPIFTLLIFGFFPNTIENIPVIQILLKEEFRNLIIFLAFALTFLTQAYKNVLFKHRIKNAAVEYNQEKLNLLAEEIKAYEHETEKDMQKLKDEHIDKLHPTMSGKKSATLDENADALLKYMDKNSIDNISLVPVVGKIAAGQPILAEEYLEGYLPVDPNIYGMASTDDYFYLRVAGQSMNLKEKNGDYALIHKQDYAENGDIVVAIVNGDDEATLKKYKKLNEQFILLEPMSSDPTIEAITIDLKTTNFRIIGKAIGQFGKF